MAKAPQSIRLSIVLGILAVIATLAWVLPTLAWVLLFLGISSWDYPRIGDLFLLATTLGTVALGFSLAIRFLTWNERERTRMLVASVLFAAALVLLGLNSWEWHQISTGASYCTGCAQFFYLPLFAIFAAIGGFTVEMVGIRQRWTEQRPPRPPQHQEP